MNADWQSHTQKWLERTPCIALEKGELFWQRYTSAVHRYLADLRTAASRAKDETQTALANAEMDKMRATFDSILDERQHNELVAKGERRLSHRAMQGALLIYFYREQQRFSQPYMILTYLMDIDSYMTQWRCESR